MENNEENDAKKHSIGGGIITVSILELLYFIYMTFVSLMWFAQGSKIKETLKSQGTTVAVSGLEIELTLAVSIIILASLILILLKKTIGIYLYFLCSIAYIVVTIKFNGFYFPAFLLWITFPIIMGVFIFRRKEVFGLNMNKIKFK